MNTVNNPSVTTRLQENDQIFLSHYQRANALDALRGIAVLAMVLSGTIAREILPAWMYHAQLPPPLHQFNPKLPGLTWVDLVFPFFLFAMGAAIPLAFSRYISQGWKIPKVLWTILQRFFLLLAFAIILQHFRPTVINPNEFSWDKWKWALKGFVLIFLMFVRWPKFIPIWLGKTLNCIAFIGGIVVINTIDYPQGIGFDLKRSDIILLVLANVYLFGSMIWYFTRSNWWLRLGILGLLFAFKFSATTEGWIKLIWVSPGIPGIFQWDYLKYLLIVIPGTWVGDLIGYWLESMQEFHQRQNSWKPLRFLIILGLMIALNLTLLIGLQNRQVLGTTVVTLMLGCLGWFLCQNPRSATERLLHYLYKGGWYLLMFGLLWEPYGGGIKKDPATLSYFFITTGMAITFLMALMILIDVFRLKSLFFLFIDNGKNPMLGYMGFANLIWPILVLRGWEPIIIEMTATDPLKGFLRGFFYTLVLGLIVSLISRCKLFLRT